MKNKRWIRLTALVVAAALLWPLPAVTFADGALIVEERTASAQAQAGYYGSQLSGASREIYDALAEHKQELQAEPDITVTFQEPVAAEDYDSSVAQRAWDAFIYDNPDIFWLDIGGTTNESAGLGRYVYTCTLSLRDEERGLSSYNGYYNSHHDTLAQDQRLVAQAVAEVADAARQLDSRYAQIKYIHQWLASNNRYNEAASDDMTRYPLAHQAVSALVADRDGGPVCDGYSRAFMLICQKLGIPCVIISGTGFTRGEAGSHMWNAVQMEDGKWYGVDVTWDDTDGNGGKGVIDTYLLVGSAAVVESGRTFGSTHEGSGVFSTGGYAFDLPVLSERSYVAAAREDAVQTVDAKTLAQVQSAISRTGGKLAGTPSAVSLVERGAFMNTVNVRFAGMTAEPTAIVRIDGDAVTPVPARWQMAEGVLTAQVQLTEDGILAPVTMAGKTFTDLAGGAWYTQVVKEAVERLWMSGTASDTFDPDGQLTGAQCRAILLRVLGNPCEDAAPGEPWYGGSERTAAELGFAGSGTGALEPMTRAEAADAITHALTLMGKERSLSAADVERLLGEFTDSGELDEYTRYALAMLVDYGILQGTGSHTLSPDAPLSRAQMAALCSRMAAVMQ